MDLRVHTEETDGVPTVVADGRLSLHTSAMLMEAVLVLLEHRPARMLIDMEAVRLTDIGGANALLIVDGAARRAGTELVLVAAHRDVVRALSQVEPANQVRHADDLEEARRLGPTSPATEPVAGGHEAP